jgi:nucleoid-associated protein YgaU
MGLFSFLKNAGAALVGGGGEKKDAPQPSSSDAMKELADSQLAMRLSNHVMALGLGVENLVITVDGDRATIYGVVDSQSEREKVILAVGNVAGVASVDDHLSVSAPEPEAEVKFYEVKKGDSLSKISKEFYGSYKKYMLIFEANKPMLKDPDKIYPGQVLRIPPAE